MAERSKKKDRPEENDSEGSRSETLLSRRTFLQAGSGLAAATLLAPVPLADGAAAEVAGSGARDAFEAPECYSGPQYKRRGLGAIAKIADGDYDAAIACLHQHLDAYPGDPEFFYGLAIAHAQKREFDEALRYVQKALRAGLSPGRFRAGPRELTAPFARRADYQKLVGRGKTGLVHGPLLGVVTEERAQFWVRTAQESSVRVTVRPADEPGTETIQSDTVRTRRAKDYTAIVRAEGLAPDARYDYRLHIEGQEAPGRWSFRTFPEANRPARFDVGFGGCAGYTPWHERIWDLIASYDFRAFIQTGDNVYIDHPTRPAVQRYCYYRRQSRPAFRRLTASVANYAIWDDHDFGTDDSRGGPHRYEPAWKMQVWHTFVNNWNNPYYAGGEEQPGCWFDFSIADVDFFMLDDRYYRTDPKEEPASMLGPVQKAWLFERLSASDATFKMVVTSVPWAYGTKPGSLDPWQGYKQEREEIFSFLEEHRIEGVILLSGDRHRADIWQIEREKGYTLYGLENARLTNIHTHEKLPGALKSYNETCTFGRLRFDTTKSDPEVYYEVITIDDEVAYDFTLRRSQLSY